MFCDSVAATKCFNCWFPATKSSTHFQRYFSSFMAAFPRLSCALSKHNSLLNMNDSHIKSGAIAAEKKTDWSLTHFFTWIFIGRLLANHQTNNFTNLENWKIYTVLIKSWKYCNKRRNCSFFSNFAFYCNVFKSSLRQQASKVVRVR